MEASLQRLARMVPGQCRWNAPLAPLTSWRMGGPADLLLEPRDEGTLAAVLRCAGDCGLRLALLAGGSNLLCADQGLRGAAIRLVDVDDSPLARMRLKAPDIIEAGAACSLAALTRFAARQGLAGLEHAANIPGSLGGLVVMNGGSMRRCIGDSLLVVRALTQTGESVELAPADCGFAYRSSVFQHNGCIVTGARLRLTPDAPEAVMARIEQDLTERRRKFPLELPSCGSVFKSHEALYAAHGPPGRVIEDTGLKGLRVGDVQVSWQHANFFVNLGQGTARDALTLIGRVREAVRRRTGVAMECEVRYLGPDGVAVPAHEALDQAE